MTYKDATSPRPRSKNQSVGTPDNYLAAVKAIGFNIIYDLAANADNNVVPDYFSEEDDSLIQAWHQIPMLNFSGTWLWLNPPYANIKTWAIKCVEEMELGARIVMLVPASVGSTWYADWVEPYAEVLFNRGRLIFKGNDKPYPKDTMLCVYEKGRLDAIIEQGYPRCYSWPWKEEL